MAIIYLGIGSNLGFRLGHLSEGLRRLRPCGTLQNLSGVVETAPVGPQDQPPYLNRVAMIVSDLSPRGLLRAMKRIERGAGRRPTYRWGPRVLDLDLLLYDDLHVEWPGLSIPHPRMAGRAFVMEPLAQIAPDVARRLLRLEEPAETE